MTTIAAASGSSSQRLQVPLEEKLRCVSPSDKIVIDGENHIPRLEY